jgi:CheY-like chemotaxis protein
MSANDMQNSFYDKGAAGYLTKPVKPEDLDASFQRIQTYLDKKIHRILIVEDNADTRKVIKDIIGDSDTVFETASRGEVAIEKITKSSFDCIILDIGLPDYSGFELLQKFNDMNLASLPPIIIYTGRDISREEENRLRKYSQSIIIKGEKSAERLVDEVALYLHQVVKDLPEEKQNMIQMLHNSDDMFSGKNILVVDDDIRNVFAVTGALEDYDMNVFSAANGKEAVDFLQADNSIDLVLMDIMMPVMDGYEAMREIRKSPQLKNLPIIALTAKAMRGDKDICIEAGANDYLAKPLDVNRLISMMRVWIYK